MTPTGFKASCIMKDYDGIAFITNCRKKTYLLHPRRIGVVTISLALRKQRRAQRMSSSFLSRPQFWSGAEPPPPQFCAKEVAAST